MVSVLIVDDDKFLHKVLERILTIGGHQVVDHAFDGAEALKKFIQLNPKPDIILMDHRMPVMNGTTATRKLLEMDSTARIVFISADDSVYDDAIDAGAKGFLTKPIRSVSLFDALKKYME